MIDNLRCSIFLSEFDDFILKNRWVFSHSKVEEFSWLRVAAIKVGGLQICGLIKLALTIFAAIELLYWGVKASKERIFTHIIADADGRHKTEIVKCHAKIGLICQIVTNNLFRIYHKRITQSTQDFDAVIAKLRLTLIQLSNESISLSFRDDLTPEAKENKLRELRLTLLSLGYSQFKIFFNKHGNLEIIDCISFDEGLEQWQREEGRNAAKAVAKIKDAFYLSFLNLSLADLSLRTLPSQIGCMLNIDYLKLTNNQLTTIPDWIGNLNLQLCYLNNNSLTSISPQIGGLQNLWLIDLSNNPNLTELPIALGQCRSLASLRVGNTHIEHAHVAAILNATRALRDGNALEMLPARLNSWQTASGKTFELGFIEQLSLQEKQNINEWLFRLEKSNDFKSSQRPLAEAACSMLQSLNQLPDFKENFFAQINVNQTGCGDRASMSFNEIFLAWKLATLDPNASEKDKLSLMAQAAKTVALRKALQRKISQHGGQQRESVEIYLYYETNLRERLDLLSFMNGMLYTQMGRCNWIDESDLIQEVNRTHLDCMADFPALEAVCDKDDNFNTLWEPEKNTISAKQEPLQSRFENGEINEWQYHCELRKITDELKATKKNHMRRWLDIKLFKNE